MGFLDSVTKIGERLTKGLEESGLMDALRDPRAEARRAASSSGASAGTANPSSERLDTSQGGIDPMGLLTTDEVAGVMGTEMNDGYPYFDDEWLGVTYTSVERSPLSTAELRIAFYSDEGTAPEAHEFFETYLKVEMPNAWVDDTIGDEALVDGETWFVRSGRHVLMAFTTGTRDGAQELLAIAMTRLP